MKLPSSNDSDNGGSLAEINITPLVDVMLVLLIIFMVTAPMIQEGIPINLPNASAEGVNMEKDDITLNINEFGSIFINDEKDEPYSLTSIEPKLAEIFKERKKKELYLRADKAIKYGYVVQVMAAARRSGVETLGMITQASDEEVEENTPATKKPTAQKKSQPKKK